ncbi:MAG: hypothetical protein ABW019_09245 [Chitinophagaceae bacterium]
MYKYPGFEEKIITVFKPIIEKYQFEPKFLSADSFSTLHLENPYCIIRFTYDIGEVGCVFINPRTNTNAVYPAYSVLEYLFPTDKENFRSADWDVDVQVHHFFRLIESRLRNVLNGDFSWTEAYQNNSRLISSRIAFVMNNFTHSHSIVQKFWNADPSWESDLDAYLLNHGLNK